MAKNGNKPHALHISLPVPAGVKAGDPVSVGNIRGVAQIDRDADGKSTLWLDGSWDLTVTGALATVGLPVYIKSDRTLSATAADGVLFGTALATKAATAGVVEVAPIGYAQV